MQWSDGRPRPSNDGQASRSIFAARTKVRLGQSVHGVGPERDLDFAPAQQDVGMMALLFSDIAHAIYEGQCGLEIGKLVSADDVMFIDDLPLRRLRQHAMNVGEILAS